MIHYQNNQTSLAHVHILSMLMTLYMFHEKESGNVVKMCWMLFVLQTSSLPGTTVFYLSVAFEPNLLLLGFAETHWWFNLKHGWGPALGCVVVLVSILSVCVFGLISVLTDLKDVKWRLVSRALAKDFVMQVSVACGQY